MQIAEYSTEEKAKKAMEELRYAYMCHSLVKMGKSPLDGIDKKITMGLSGVFQFPTAEEIGVAYGSYFIFRVSSERYG